MSIFSKLFGKSSEREPDPKIQQQVEPPARDEDEEEAS